jgi:hypothetical protein
MREMREALEDEKTLRKDLEIELEHEKPGALNLLKR